MGNGGRTPRDGLIEHNQTTGEEARISQRGQELLLRQTPASENMPLREEGLSTKRPSRQPAIARTNSVNDSSQRCTVTQRETNAPVTDSPGRHSVHHAEYRQSDSHQYQQFQSEQLVQSQGTALTTDTFSPDPPSADASAGDTALSERSVPDSPTDALGTAEGEPSAVDATPIAQSTPKKNSRLQFHVQEATPRDKPDRKITKLQGKVQKIDAKLETAQAALPTKKRLRTERSFDAEKGEARRKIHFEQVVKTQREHLKGSLPSRPIKAGANVIIGTAHGKISQVEQENVGVEAGHRVAILAESTVRRGYHLHKTAPYRRVEKLSHAAARQHVKLTYQETLQDNPKLQSNAVSRFLQKQKIKWQYAKAARDAKRTGQTLKRVGTVVSSAAKAVVAAVRQHPAVVGIVLGIGLLVLIVMSMFGSCANIAGSVLGGVLSGSYVAEDGDINNAEKAYTEWETDLALQIDNVETDYPDFNEYRYDLGEIGHDPYLLLAYLTAKYQDYTFPKVQGELLAIFGQQYSLAFLEEVEIRYREGEDGRDEPYNWYILNVTLTVKPLEDILGGRMDTGQKETYDTLVDTKGNRQYSLNPFAFDWLPYITSEYGWRVHPITGAKDFHNAVDIGVAQGTSILAGHDGIVSTASYDGDGYGYYITLQGQDGISTRYAHCSSLLVSVGQTVKKGVTIAKSGNTGNSTGPHLHFEVMKDGQALNPRFFALTEPTEIQEEESF